jgi:hypothetical protein
VSRHNRAERFFWSALDKIEARLDWLLAGSTRHVISPTLCKVTTTVTRITLHGHYSDADTLAFVQAFSENGGIVTLYLNSAPITDEMWVVLWRSVARHPKLEKLVLLRYTSSMWRDGNMDAQKTLRMKTMVDALRVNTGVLHTIAPF